MPHVNLRWTGNVATVWLNRPDRHNAMSLAAWEDLRDAFREIGERDDVRVALLRGVGPSLSSGADLGEFVSLRASADGITRYDAVIAEAFDALAALSCPVIVAMTGNCIGGGLELALGCDIRLCARGAKIGIPIVRLGHALDETRLRQLIQAGGLAVAQELLLEGLVFDADEALVRGLVHRVVDLDALDDEIEACVDRLVAAAPLSVRWHKRALVSISMGKGVTAELQRESMALALSKDHREGVSALLARRAPVFKGS